MGLVELPAADDLGRIEDAILFGLTWQVGAGAMTLLATVSAQVGDHARARATVRWALPLLERHRATTPGLFAAGSYLAEWMRWARSYLDHFSGKAIMARNVAPGAALDGTDRQRLAPIAEALSTRIGAFTLSAHCDSFGVCEAGHCGVLVAISYDGAAGTDAEAFTCLFGAARVKDSDLPSRITARLRAELAAMSSSESGMARSPSELAGLLSSGHLVRILEA